MWIRAGSGRRRGRAVDWAVDEVAGSLSRCAVGGVVALSLAWVLEQTAKVVHSRRVQLIVGDTGAAARRQAWRTVV